jgi:bacteriorhodopsin
VTFIAAYHYFRIFNSWNEAYKYPTPEGVVDTIGATDPALTGIPFNDAYRYMDWLLTVPLLLMEIVLTMTMSPEESSSYCKKLGFAAALMIILGYPGELLLEGALDMRWKYWAAAMVPFLYIVFTLLVGLSEATARESDPAVKSLIQQSQLVTVISWCTYPVVYVFPMLGLSGANAVVAIQCGYCVSDIISKCGVGLFIYHITSTKSENERKQGLVQ